MRDNKASRAHDVLLQTACMAVGLGTACTVYEPAIVLEALCLTAAIVVGLTMYTFYAVRKGVSFQRLGPILFCGVPTCLFAVHTVLKVIHRRGLSLQGQVIPDLKDSHSTWVLISMHRA